jgi:hypothetical protein
MCVQQRVPSGMIGDKNTCGSILEPGTEGSLRNHLAVWGPGVPSGGIDNTLLTQADVLPTIADLAGTTDTEHDPWVSSDSLCGLFLSTNLLSSHFFDLNLIMAKRTAAALFASMYNMKPPVLKHVIDVSPTLPAVHSMHASFTPCSTHLAIDAGRNISQGLPTHHWPMASAAPCMSHACTAPAANMLRPSALAVGCQFCQSVEAGCQSNR